MENNRVQYKKIKEALSKKRENVKYFTEEFFNTFVEERLKSLKLYAEGKNAGDGYVKTHESDFYLKCGGAYCEFLEIYHSSLERYEIQYFVDGYYYPVHTDRESVENEEAAEDLAKGMLIHIEAKRYKIRRVA